MKRNYWSLIGMLMAGLIAGCGSAGPDPDPAYQWSLPAGVTPPPVPDDNALTEGRVALGKRLFYDPILSLDSTVSCASCHRPEKGFADSESISPGVKGRLGFRNAPTLTQVGYSPYFFAEGGAPTLELQALGPIDNHTEFGFSAAELYERLREHPEYNELAQAYYGRDFDLYVLTRAIAAFERTLVSYRSPFDRFLYQGEESALTPAQRRGWNLFRSDALQCRSCHSGFAFSSYQFANVGLYQKYEDEGLTRRTMLPEDIGKFKIPTLRNIALTAPYMHDGSLPDLESVVTHFNSGGRGHTNQSALIRPLQLSEQEQADLVAFLHALTDSAMITDPELLPE